jgi:ectoine hydroxylase-related dioxygenase (phytanoyl-CoA dioxygenase family)
MALIKFVSDFVRTFKITYIISNLFNYNKLKKNAVLYKKYGLKKSVIAPISSKDFAKVPAQPKSWLDEKSLKEITAANNDFQRFPKNIQDSLINWSEDGYAILPGFFSKQAEEVNRTIKDKLKNGEIKFRYGNKIMFAMNRSELIRNIGNEPLIVNILSFLMGKEATLFQSINFIEGSKQKAHSDIVHMTTYPQGYLIAIWIALEDIKEEQGALFYYPGSQKLPYILNEDFNHGGSYLRLGENAYAAYEDRVEKQIQENGLKKKVFEAKKGDVLIWHANLLHGGSAITKPGSTRKSMVFHYYADGVICYHEISQRPAVF